MTLTLLTLHVLYAIVLLILRAGLFRASRMAKHSGLSPVPSVTVLVPFRNEAPNLESICTDLLEQDYPQHLLQILLIDDHSTDAGVERVSAFGQGIQLLQLPEHHQGKKAALEAGVAAADSEWIFTTDADCRVPRGWVSSLVQAGEERNACMVCGTVAIDPAPGFLNAVQQLETHLLQRCGIASLALGFPLLNTGASLAFRRKTFLELGGYSGNRHLASGDDTFLMLSMHAAFPGRVVPCLHPDAQVTTAAEPKWSSFLNQRLRRASKVKHYGSLRITLTGAVLFLGQCATLVAFLAFPFGFLSLPGLLVMLVLRFLPEFMLMGRLGSLRLWLAAVPVSLGFPLLNIPVVLPRSPAATTWKGRPLVNKKHN